jgi:hypothetical protein
MSHLESLQELIDLLESAKPDADMFDRGNGEAGTRLRVKALEVRKGLDGMRKSVQALKKTRSSS